MCALNMQRSWIKTRFGTWKARTEANNSKRRLAVISVVCKYHSATEVIRLYLFDLQPIYTYCTETLLAPSDEINVLYF
jgi:hypothetical protein